MQELSQKNKESKTTAVFEFEEQQSFFKEAREVFYSDLFSCPGDSAFSVHGCYVFTDFSLVHSSDSFQSFAASSTLLACFQSSSWEQFLKKM